MLESIILVSYNVISLKPYVALTSNLTDTLILERVAGGADNEISTKLHKNLEYLIDRVIHLMIAYNMVGAHTKVKVNGIKGKLMSCKKNEAIKDLLTRYFDDAWVAKRSLGSSDEVTLTVPREVKGCVPNKAPWALDTILDSKLLSFKWQEAVSDILSASTKSDPSTTRQYTNINASISKYDPSEIQRLVDVNQIKCIHFGHVAIFSSTGLLIALVELRPFTTMSEVEVNQWDELSQFLFCKRRFTNLIATNGALLEGFMFAIGWCKCSTKIEQFGQSLRYVGDNLFEKIQNCYKSLGVPSFDQVNYEANIPTNQGAFEFSSALTFTMNGFKNTPHLDKDLLLYDLGWWVQADKQTGQIQRDASK
ncbi:hypothetical protein O181_036754 [Austropuccinia psidii MF-1]|uniref:Tet-like 2OG-Fe(II) oxygenase domain-containing protein n=1 Tax=Austropuccinia psidii MF-1 TaxID=1389203 RepID=A0A9Q3D593_9BASI|nr:hypothetical protein [Austropuccinia psidii MF-1]